MARKTKILTIEGDSSKNRDVGKQFFITEMPAWKAEKWAGKAFLALVNAGANLPSNAASAGMAGMAVAGLSSLAGMRFDVAEPLLDELMTCVEYMPPAAPGTKLKDLNNHIEEIETFVILRREALLIHTNFSWDELRSKWVENSGSAEKAPAT